MYIDLVLVFEIIKVVIVFLAFVGLFFLALIINKECGPVRYPWEKEERKAAKKRAKEEERARREFWGS